MDGLPVLLLGVVLGALAQAQLPALRHFFNRRTRSELTREQLLAWIDASPQG